MSGRKLATAQDMKRFFQFITLFIPAVAIIYANLAELQIVQAPIKISSEQILIFSFWLLLISSLQFLIPSKTSRESTLRVIIYNLLIGSYIVFVTGVNSPFTVFWIVLMVASYGIMARRGLAISVGFAAIFIILDAIIFHRIGPDHIIFDSLALITLITSGIFIIKISDIHKGTRIELEKSRARETLQHNRALTIINNLADAVLSTDPKGIIQVYNAASMGLLDTNASLNGHFIDDALPLVDSSGEKVSLFNELKNAKTVTKRDDLIHIFSADDEMRLEVIFSPIRRIYGENKASNDGYVLILRDITKAKSLEEEKDEFVSVVSHELRTPITIAEGTLSNAQIMLDHPDTTKDMLKDSINLAHDQVIFLAGMVNDLSTLSRAERGIADAAEYIDIRELARKLYDKYLPEAKEKGLSLDLDLSAKLGGVMVSRLYLEEMLQNFITNSIKYTKKGSVKLSFKQKDNEIMFAIKDTGIGISKSDQAKIFQKFYRSEDYRTRETSGTGLGLYITAKLAHKIGVKIDVKSRLNFGSTFSFSLPVSKEPEEKK